MGISEEGMGRWLVGYPTNFSFCWYINHQFLAFNYRVSYYLANFSFCWHAASCVDKSTSRRAVRTGGLRLGVMVRRGRPPSTVDVLRVKGKQEVEGEASAHRERER